MLTYASSVNDELKAKWETFFEVFDERLMYNLGFDKFSLFYVNDTIFNVIERYIDSNKMISGEYKKGEGIREICCKKFFSK